MNLSPTTRTSPLYRKAETSLRVSKSQREKHPSRPGPEGSKAGAITGLFPLSRIASRVALLVWRQPSGFDSPVVSGVLCYHACAGHASFPPKRLFSHWDTSMRVLEPPCLPARGYAGFGRLPWQGLGQDLPRSQAHGLMLITGVAAASLRWDGAARQSFAGPHAPCSGQKIGGSLLMLTKTATGSSKKGRARGLELCVLSGRACSLQAAGAGAGVNSL